MLYLVSSAEGARRTCDFSFSPDQLQLRERSRSCCAGFDDEYWLAKDRDGGFPHDFHPRLRGRRLARRLHAAAIRRRGPRRHRSRADDADHRRVRRGRCRGASALHMNIFGLNPVVVFGTDEQKKRMLPPLIARRGQGLLRGHRAERRPRHAQAQDQGGARRRPLPAVTARKSGSRPRRSRARC